LPYLCQRSGENDDFKLRAEAREKCIDAWPLEDVYVVNLAVDFDGNNVISVCDGL